MAEPDSRAYRDFGAEAQKAAEAHLQACNEALDAQDEGEDVESPASAPYCGCDTCLVREVLFAAWAVMDAYLDDAGSTPGPAASPPEAP